MTAPSGILCLLPGEERFPCDAVHVIECGHDSGIDGIPGAVVLSCTLDPGHDGDHHDIDGIWWRADD